MGAQKADPAIFCLHSQSNASLLGGGPKVREHAAALFRKDHGWAPARPSSGERCVPDSGTRPAGARAAEQSPRLSRGRAQTRLHSRGRQQRLPGRKGEPPAALALPEGTSTMQRLGLPEGPQQARVCRDHPPCAHTSAPLSPGPSGHPSPLSPAPSRLSGTAYPPSLPSSLASFPARPATAMGLAVSSSCLVALVGERGWAGER